MKEIGGYIELDTYTGKMLHEDAVKLNCGRNSVEYLVRAKGIKKVLMPKFMCSSCAKVFVRNNVDVTYYSVDENLRPIVPSREDNQWLFIVNYYGQFTNEYIKSFGKNLIVDNSMAYFQQHINGIDTFASCRKYFGVPDGAILYTDIFLEDIEQDVSYSRMNYLLGRYENGPQPFYQEYVENNHSFSDDPVLRMSKLTENLLHGIDYNFVRNTRTKNFTFLNDEFQKINKLDLVVPEGAFMYPLYIYNGEIIRKKLQEQQIYIPTLWPAVYNICDETELEVDLAKNILPIPVDQRYGIEEMEYIISRIKDII